MSSRRIRYRKRGLSDSYHLPITSELKAFHKSSQIIDIIYSALQSTEKVQLCPSDVSLMKQVYHVGYILSLYINCGPVGTVPDQVSEAFLTWNFLETQLRHLLIKLENGHVGSTC